MIKKIMFQGTGSDVGKSIIVAGFCRTLKKLNISPVPFKPQNMSNNAGITIDGGEIGRSQILQAKACNLEPHTDMNPVLLKPQSNMSSQIVVQGKVLQNCKSEYFRELKPKLIQSVLESFNRLADSYDIVVVEGAGSPAEINLREGDIANMGFATQTNTPVILVVDVDRGGSIASVVGTYNILPENERKLIVGYIINKFRGDISLYQGAIDEITNRTKLKCFGILPWFEQAKLLPAEDGLGLDNIKNQENKTDFKICVLRTPRISNFDDLDPLFQTKNITVQVLENGQALPIDCDMVLLVGSKSTISDLKYIKDCGWENDIISHYRRGGFVMGICGGYQMLGKKINDPKNYEGNIKSIDGIRLLDCETTMSDNKNLSPYVGTDIITNTKFSGYKMHMGITTGNDTNNPFSIDINNKKDGAISKCGKVFGSYVHSIFNDDTFRQKFLKNITGFEIEVQSYDKNVETTLDQLACHIEKYIDIDEILKISH